MPSHCPLANFTFNDLHLEATKRPITAISPTATISEALEFMKQNDSITVPIESRSGIGNQVAAVVGVSDIIGYILRAGGIDGIDKVDLDKERIENVESLGLGEEEEESYRIWERDFRDTLEATLVAFARRIHRAMITDALGEKKPYLMTQADIIRYVYANPSSVTPTIDVDLPVKVSLINSLTTEKHVISMRDDQSVIEGFEIMRKNKIAALPVVNGSGWIVANLSASDLRGITRGGLEQLKRPVLEYLKSRNSSDEPKPPVVCTPEDSLRDILKLLVTNHVHRVWVVESATNMKPVGVVSQSDIIGSFVGVQAQ